MHELLIFIGEHQILTVVILLIIGAVILGVNAKNIKIHVPKNER